MTSLRTGFRNIARESIDVLVSEGLENIGAVFAEARFYERSIDENNTSKLEDRTYVDPCIICIVPLKKGYEHSKKQHFRVSDDVDKVALTGYCCGCRQGTYKK